MNNSLTIPRSAKVVIPILFLLAGLIISLPAGANPVSPAKSVLEQASLPAKGKQETILNISDFGRYAVTVKSPQGTALKLIDRLSGPGEVHGIIGEKDGRLDLILDRGAYKIITYSHDKGSGKASLQAHDFKELNSPRPPLLEDLKLVSTQLGDFAQRSYWLDIKQRKNIIIEAGGRNLTDLRLWKDGNWLLDVLPKKEIIEPQIGKPLNYCIITAELNPGLYLLTAYGGLPQPWEKTSKENPLYIRSGIPKLAEAGRNRYITSPFGIDRWLTPAKANFYRMELSSAKASEIQVKNFSERTPFSGYGHNAAITKKSLPPAAEIMMTGSRYGHNMVTIKCESGTPYILQHFENKSHYTFKDGGDHFITTIHSGHGEDVADATAILTERAYRRNEKLFASRAIEIDNTAGWRRSFNMLEELTLFFEVKAPGKYIAKGSGATARFRFEPFHISRPRNYRAPYFQDSGHKWSLDRGFYVLTARPVEGGKGIVDLIVKHENTGKVETSPAAIAAQFPAAELIHGNSYAVYLNRQPGVKSGIIVRKLPADLSTPLPITVQRQDLLVLDIRVPESGRLSAVAEDGTQMGLSIDGRSWNKEWNIKPGDYTINVGNKTDKALNCTLSLSPSRFDASTPLPQITEKMLASLPDFLELRADKPRYFDVERREERSFLVNVKKPGLYRLESSGLLRTEGNLRTRINPSFDRQRENGIGQNFLIQQYLKEGEYQLTTGPKGDTRGHMGLLLNPTKLNVGGSLMYNTPARYTLHEGEGLVYWFDIKEKGRYSLKAMGLDRTFRMRLEDADGWPLIKPGMPASLTQELHPGRYRFVILPQPVEARVVTLLEPVTAKPEFKGHGPHLISSELLDQTINHVWMEPGKGKERIPDQWKFNVPAPLDLVLTLSEKMTGELHKEGSTDKKIIIKPGKPLEHRVEKGKYLLSVKSVRKNNRLDYGLNINFKQLVSGQKRFITAPVKIPVSMGNDGMTELLSVGDQDVRARLYDKDGKLVGRSDDRKDDWNFHIAENLRQGFYTLHIEPVGKKNAHTTIFMEKPDEINENPAKLPADIKFITKGLHIFPLQNTGNKDIIIARADSVESLIMGIEKYDDGKWNNIGSSSGSKILLGAALDGKAQSRYRILVQSADKREGKVRLQAASILSKTLSESNFTGKGIKLSRVKSIEPEAYAGSVQPDQPGLFRVVKGNPHISISASYNNKFEKAKKGLFFATREKIRLLSMKVDSRIKAERLVIKAKGMQVDIPENKYSSMNLGSSAKGPVLVLAESRIDQPGISLESLAADTPETISCMAVDNLSAVAVNLNPEKSKGRLKTVVWNAGKKGSLLPVNVSQYNFPAMNKQNISWGINDTLLKPLTAGNFSMPVGTKRLRLSLPPETAAVLNQEGKIQTVCWSGRKSIVRTIDTKADSLALLYIGDNAAHANTALSGLDDDNALSVFKSKAIIQHYFSNAGSRQFEIRLSEKEKTSGMKLKVYGNGAEAVIIENNGKVAQGTSFQLTDNATLVVNHKPGLFIAWMEGDDSNPWKETEISGTMDILPPQNIPLGGKAVKLDFKPAKDSLVHLSTDVPVIAYIKSGVQPSRLEVFPEGADLPVFMPSTSSSYIILKPAAAASLSGTAGIQATDIISVNEGPGPKIRLEPGSSRAFAFTANQKGKVGIGVRATADIATCSLMDSHGKIIGNGVVQMHDLSPGNYLLSIETPPNGFGVEVQPVIIGLEQPDTGPPDATIRKYMEMEGLKPST